MDKSYVTMEQHQCPVCGVTFDTGAILLDRRLLNKFDNKTVTSYSLCSECQIKIDEGFTILIVVKDGENSANPYRTGEILYYKSIDPTNKPTSPIMYIEESAAKEIKAGHEET